MNNGVILFAHNSRDIDYASMALISGGLAKKNLKVPVSLITDISTIDFMKKEMLYEKAVEIFDKIILNDRPEGNNRILHDGNTVKYVPFINQNRSSVYSLSPYDRTLLIDSDFLIFTDRLGQFWNTDSDLMIAESFTNIRDQDPGVLDQWVSETGPTLYWATTVMFSKSKMSEIFFNLVDHIKDNYKHYSKIYRFNSLVYRNDVSFSIAKHILDDFSKDKFNNLPSILSVIDRDTLEIVKDDSSLMFLIGDDLDYEKRFLVKIKDLDVHIMNKQSILRNKNKLLGLL
jgi:hypothetical protein